MPALPGRNRAAIRQLHIEGNRAKIKASKRAGHSNREFAIMKIFLDTANLDEIRQGVSLGVVDGVTTNPTLVAKENRPFRDHILEICEIVKDGVVNAEVVSTDTEGILTGSSRDCHLASQRRGEDSAHSGWRSRVEYSGKRRHSSERDSVLLGNAGAAGGQSGRVSS